MLRRNVGCEGFALMNRVLVVMGSSVAVVLMVQAVGLPVMLGATDRAVVDLWVRVCVRVCVVKGGAWLLCGLCGEVVGDGGLVGRWVGAVAGEGGCSGVCLCGDF